MFTEWLSLLMNGVKKAMVYRNIKCIWLKGEDFSSFTKIKVVIMLSFIVVRQSLSNIKTLICCSVLPNGKMAGCPWVRLMLAAV